MSACGALRGKASLCHKNLPYSSGAILTKMDGDSRGGAALSMKAVSGRPVKFISTGEKMEALEAFYPDRIASRILGNPFLLSNHTPQLPIMRWLSGVRIVLG